jgi:acyl dehydratase
MPPLILESYEALNEFVGKELAVSDWILMTQERINCFAEASEDRQWIHIDRDRAKKESPYGTTIAHGFLTLSLIGHLMHESIHIRKGPRLAVNYGLNRLRFPAPVREGSRIRGRFSLLAFKDLGDSFEAIFACTVECEGSEKPCCVAEWIVRYYK